MTSFLAAYDTESPVCLAAVEKIAEVHRRRRVPATFFMVSRILEKDGEGFRQILGDDPLFEVASHSSTHMLLRPHRICGEPGPESAWEDEIAGSKKRLEDAFGREVVSFRPPFGFVEGLKGAPDLVRLTAEAGYRVVSSRLWGPDFTLPALGGWPEPYTEEGFPNLWEVPGDGWHDNVLTGISPSPKALLLFPEPYPGACPSRFSLSPQEAAEAYKACLDFAAATGRPQASPIWHPWSLGRFDPGMEILERTLDHVEALGLPCLRFCDYRSLLWKGGELRD